MRHTKTPKQMRRDAQERRNPQPASKPLGDVDPAKLPLQVFETPAELEVTKDWLVHIAACRIEVR